MSLNYIQIYTFMNVVIGIALVTVVSEVVREKWGESILMEIVISN